MKALNYEKALIGPFSRIVKPSLIFVSSFISRTCGVDVGEELEILKYIIVRNRYMTYCHIWSAVSGKSVTQTERVPHSITVHSRTPGGYRSAQW